MPVMSLPCYIRDGDAGAVVREMLVEGRVREMFIEGRIREVLGGVRGDDFGRFVSWFLQASVHAVVSRGDGDGEPTEGD